jgi:flagellar basal body-associated protein FliL
MKKEISYEFDEPLTPEIASYGNKKIQRVLIFILPILLLIFGSCYFFFFVIKTPKITSTEATQQKNVKENTSLTPSSYFDMDPITVGLAQSGAKREYLRLTLTIKLNNDKEISILANSTPIIRDCILTFLRSLRSTDFNSSESAIYLKEELTKRINKVVAPLVIREVLFQEMTVN